MQRSVGTGIVKSTASSLIALTFTPLIIRNIGMNQYGKWSLLFIFIGIAPILELGLSRSTVLVLSRQRNDHAQTLGAILAIGILLASAFIAASCTLAASPQTILPARLQIQNTSILIHCGGALLVLNLGISVAQSILEANLRIDLVNATQLLSSFLLYTTTFLTSLFTQDLPSLLLSTVVTYAIVLTTSVMMVRRFTNHEIAAPNKTSFATVGLTMRRFFALCLVNAATQPTTRYLVAASSIGGGELAIIDIAFRVAQAASNLLNAFSAPLLSMFAKLSTTDVPRILRTVSIAATIMLALLILGVTTFQFTGEYLLAIMTDNQADGCFTPTLTLIVGLGLLSVTSPAERALWCLGRINDSTLARIAAIFAYPIAVHSFSTFPTASQYAIAHTAYLITSAAIISVVFLLSTRTSATVSITR